MASCGLCGGSGKCRTCDGKGTFTSGGSCSSCHGTKKCNACFGTGKER